MSASRAARVPTAEALRLPTEGALRVGAVALGVGLLACAPEPARVAPPGWAFTSTSELRPDSP